MADERPKSVTLMLRWMEIKSNFRWELWIGPIEIAVIWEQLQQCQFVAFGRGEIVIDPGPHQSLEDAQKAAESAVMAWSKREPKVKR